MEKSRECYKVLWVDPNGELWSWYHENKAKFSVNYKPNEIVKPKIGKLFVFDDIESAVAFYLGKKGNTVIYKVLAYDVEPSPKWIVHVWAGESKIEEYWNNRPIDNIALMTVPDGALVCSSLELLEEVEWIP